MPFDGTDFRMRAFLVTFACKIIVCDVALS